MKKTMYLSLLFSVMTIVISCFALSQEARDKGFVYFLDINTGETRFETHITEEIEDSKADDKLILVGKNGSYIFKL